jgi:hypothetical protein
MSYGLLCSGSNGQALIDSDHGVLHVMDQGLYSGRIVNGNGDSDIVVYYRLEIDSDYPPVVFISPDGPGTYLYFAHIGGPGKWIGFTVRVVYEFRIMDGFSRVGKYCACGLSPNSLSGYGMQVSDETSKLVFDSGYKIVEFLGGAQVWDYAGYVYLGILNQAWLYSLPWTFGLDGYFMVSVFGQGFTSPNSIGNVSIGFSKKSRDYIQLIHLGFPAPLPPVMNSPLLVAKP